MNWHINIKRHRQQKIWEGYNRTTESRENHRKERQRELEREKERGKKQCTHVSIQIFMILEFKYVLSCLHGWREPLWREKRSVFIGRRIYCNLLLQYFKLPWVFHAPRWTQGWFLENVITDEMLRRVKSDDIDTEVNRLLGQDRGRSFVWFPCQQLSYWTEYRCIYLNSFSEQISV